MNVGYHVSEISKGILGEASKLEEEVEELADALSQGNKLMALQELSDIYGAMEAMLEKRFPHMRMSDLEVMAHATRSAFLDGTRQSAHPVINIGELRRRHTSIHFFGLGFIQIKLGEFERVHVYHPDLPAFVDEPHDHRYDFESKVLLGSITNTVYEFVRSDNAHTQDWFMSETSCIPDGSISTSEVPMQLIGKMAFETPQGSSYTMGRDQFHTIKTTPRCVTHLRRSAPAKQFARVVRRSGVLPVCPFSKVIPNETLWRYVEDVFQSL